MLREVSRMVNVEEEKVERGEERPRKAVYYCPLYSAAFGAPYPCIKEKCAWWGGELRGCAVQALFDLTTIVEVVGR